MIKIFIQILITVLVFLTLIISAKKPVLHKTVLIYDSNFILENYDEKKEPASNIVIQSKKQTQKQTSYKIVEYKAQKEKPVPSNITTVKTTKISKNTKNISKKINPLETKTNTAQSELVEWNIWRSNIQNQIMQDTKLPPLPIGTVFKFSFDVDKFGKISNIKTYSTTPTYTPYAIQHIAPVIKSYQGREILNFPKGTIRYQTTVQGGWKISQEQKLSSPSDFYDLEKIRK